MCVLIILPSRDPCFAWPRRQRAMQLCGTLGRSHLLHYCDRPSRENTEAAHVGVRGYRRQPCTVTDGTDDDRHYAIFGDGPSKPKSLFRGYPILQSAVGGNVSSVQGRCPSTANIGKTSRCTCCQWLYASCETRGWKYYFEHPCRVCESRLSL